MESIDLALEQFKKLQKETKAIRKTVVTEADTRLKVIDPILLNVLGYPKSEISTEDYAGGDFIDYKLSVNGLARLIVEAKRDSKTFGLRNRGAGRFYRLQGAVFTEKVVKDGIAQAIKYCGVKNAELACVTNGQE
ncbi:MAG: hypothetical protein ACRD3W_19825, partial [Terriglobales bacterium]